MSVNKLCETCAYYRHIIGESDYFICLSSGEVEFVEGAYMMCCEDYKHKRQMNTDEYIEALKKLAYDLMELCDETTDEVVACSSTTYVTSASTVKALVGKYRKLHDRSRDLYVGYES